VANNFENKGIAESPLENSEFLLYLESILLQPSFSLQTDRQGTEFPCCNIYWLYLTIICYRDGGDSKSKQFPEEPEVGKIYAGKVANIVQFGCFVQLEGLRRRWEGLVHVSQLRREGRVTNVSDVVVRGSRVRVGNWRKKSWEMCLNKMQQMK
jgi:hypothetical protein